MATSIFAIVAFIAVGRGSGVPDLNRALTSECADLPDDLLAEDSFVLALTHRAMVEVVIAYDSSDGSARLAEDIRQAAWWILRERRSSLAVQIQSAAAERSFAPASALAQAAAQRAWSAHESSRKKCGTLFLPRRRVLAPSPAELTPVAFSWGWPEARTATEAGASLAERADTAVEFWSENLLSMWNRVARDVITERDLSSREATLLLANLNCAMADAIHAADRSRDYYGRWRPITQSTRGTGITVRNWFGSAAMVPPIPTEDPPLREYPSLRAAIGGAAESILAPLLGDESVVIAQACDTRARAFRSISDAAREQALAAGLYDERKREAAIAGYLLGREVGRLALVEASRQSRR